MRKVFGFSVIAGLLIIIGTAGSADLGLLDMTGIVARGVIGMLLMILGYIGLEILGSESLNKRRARK